MNWKTLVNLLLMLVGGTGMMLAHKWVITMRAEPGFVLTEAVKLEEAMVMFVFAWMIIIGFLAELIRLQREANKASLKGIKPKLKQEDN